MKRITLEPRPTWTAWADSLDYAWHSEGGTCSWNEGVAYLLTEAEEQLLRTSAEQAHRMAVSAVERVVRESLWSRMGIPDKDVSLLKRSWERQEWSLGGRFDFMLDGNGQPKLIEYNAESTLTLIETAKVQRAWFEAAGVGRRQFNTLRESMVAAWRSSGTASAHVAWRPRHREVESTMRFLAEAMREAGIPTTLMAMHSLGWNSRLREFVDSEGQVIECCAKLYPWAWMLEERFASHLPHSSCRFVEPPWRHLLSSKALLALMWEQFPEHPALVPAYTREFSLKKPFVSKPLLGREGHNITIFNEGDVCQRSGGDFEGMPLMTQEFVASPRFDDRIPQFGVWMVGAEAVALGIRETDGLIVNGDSPFTPHAIV